MTDLESLIKNTVEQSRYTHIYIPVDTTTRSEKKQCLDQLVDDVMAAVDEWIKGRASNHV